MFLTEGILNILSAERGEPLLLGVLLLGVGLLLLRVATRALD